MARNNRCVVCADRPAVGREGCAEFCNECKRSYKRFNGNVIAWAAARARAAERRRARGKWSEGYNAGSKDGYEEAPRHAEGRHRRSAPK